MLVATSLSDSSQASLSKLAVLRQRFESPSKPITVTVLRELRLALRDALDTRKAIEDKYVPDSKSNEADKEKLAKMSVRISPPYPNKNRVKQTY